MDWLAFGVTLLVGVACIIIGILNRHGNLKMLHSYHYKRVKPEDILPFGKLVGLGMILFGIGIIIFSIFSMLSVILTKEFYMWIGMGVMVLFMVVGSVFMFYAMKKYNKGIF